MKVIPVAAYAMNICRFNVSEMKQLDQTIRMGKNMLQKHASNERLYLKRKKGEGGLRSLRDTYKETRLRVACYMAKSTNRRIEAVLRKETIKEENVIVVESVKTMEEVGVRLGDGVIDEEREWKPTWRKLKTFLQKAVESRRTENYKTKEQQSQLHQEQEDECHLWLGQNPQSWRC